MLRGRVISSCVVRFHILPQNLLMKRQLESTHRGAIAYLEINNWLRDLAQSQNRSCILRIAFFPWHELQCLVQVLILDWNGWCLSHCYPISSNRRWSPCIGWCLKLLLFLLVWVCVVWQKRESTAGVCAISKAWASIWENIHQLMALPWCRTSCGWPPSRISQNASNGIPCLTKKNQESRTCFQDTLSWKE